jgi:glyoxylase-like metal-dependent hydrolase (beta-lactamase superfamily II)
MPDDKLPDSGSAFAVGAVEVKRVVEFTGQLFTRGQVLPDSDRSEWEAARPRLEPRFWNSATDDITVAIQSFLLESDGKWILVDTGIGNRKQRPTVPQFHDRDTPFLDRLRAAGAEPAEIDVVICTHLHPDHVGWNTVLDGDRWVPPSPTPATCSPRPTTSFGIRPTERRCSARTPATTGACSTTASSRSCAQATPSCGRASSRSTRP